MYQLDTGVCTDLTIQSSRKLGIYLQKEVHENISWDFQAGQKYCSPTSTQLAKGNRPP
ncbi:hypothetical protein BTJ40_01970 [Microbulbifer sp. A4B17]|uniref:DUF1287 domain-containing protein n=1 Tax=Microbulbifer sp. A4B17 TaxID=359370 RepID=UPI000D52DAB9|nr:hypothetical protein BTJ40_01970 [Microbulbifer sp. A4B17]